MKTVNSELGPRVAIDSRDCQLMLQNTSRLKKKMSTGWDHFFQEPQNTLNTIAAKNK